MKLKVIKLVFYAVFPVLFNVLFFVLGGTQHLSSVWLSYGCIHFAYLIAVVVSAFAGRKHRAEVLRFTAGEIAFAYFCAELIAGIVFIVLSLEDITAALIVQIVLFCIFLLAFSWNAWHDARTAAEEGRRAEEVGFIRRASLRAKQLSVGTRDDALRRKLEAMYDVIRSSPSRSPQSAKGLEGKVMEMLDALAEALESGEREEAEALAERIVLAMQERNEKAAVLNDKL